MGSSILTPALALVVWTLAIWMVMYSRRIPAMQAAKIDPDSARHPGSLDTLPASARSAADNYNHLHEAPTIFYALVFYTHLAGNADPWFVVLAWAYVGLRVMHSLVQVTINKVLIRFALFTLSTLVLMAIAVGNLLMLS